MDVAALIISILALTVSIVVACVEAFRDYKITKINIEFEFYKEIYKDYLIYKIPNARRVMWIDENAALQDVDDLIDELNALRRDSLYFFYSNKSFYLELKKYTQALEDYIVKSQTRELAAEEQTAFWNEIQRYLNKIYKLISEAYCGKYD